MVDRTQVVFAALSDPTRRELISRLAGEGRKTATQLADELPVNITRQGVTKHLAALLEAGLVDVEQHGRERYYSLTPQPLDEISAWIDKIGAVWDSRLDALRKLVEDDEDETF
jgi:DNA-binding transcriptional ArsR family regulator